jgi:hypothetical protein
VHGRKLVGCGGHGLELDHGAGGGHGLERSFWSGCAPAASLPRAPTLRVGQDRGRARRGSRAAVRRGPSGARLEAGARRGGARP